MFPTEWLSAVPQKVRLEHQTTDILESVVKEEATWSDTASAHRESSLTFHVVVVAASALLLLAAGIAWACFGKERRPRWQGESWQEAPEPGMHPAVAGRLWRFDHASSKDLVASVMRVVDAGLVGLTREEAVNGVNDVQTRWFLTRKASKRDAAEAALGGESGRTAAERLDEATVSLLFDDIAEGVNTLSFDGIVRGAEAIPRQYVDAVRAWQDVVSAEVRERGLFDERGWKLQMPVVVIGVAWALVGAAAWFLQNDTTTAWAMIPAGALVALFGANLPRRSQEGSNLNAKCEAFRAWLADRPVDEAGEADAGDAGSAGEASDAAAAGEVRNAGSAGEASGATKAAEVGDASDAADASNAGRICRQRGARAVRVRARRPLERGGGRARACVRRSVEDRPRRRARATFVIFRARLPGEGPAALRMPVSVAHYVRAQELAVVARCLLLLHSCCACGNSLLPRSAASSRAL